jgi:hypothetical protein
MMSACKPGDSDPICPPKPIDSAASEVAATIASIGRCPPSLTRVMISRAFWPWPPATASVPIGIFTFAASARRNMA